jgi:hypothetical protein
MDMGLIWNYENKLEKIVNCSTMNSDVKRRKVWKLMKCQKKEKYFHQRQHDEKCINDLTLDQDKGNPWH